MLFLIARFFFEAAFSAFLGRVKIVCRAHSRPLNLIFRGVVFFGMLVGRLPFEVNTKRPVSSGVQRKLFLDETNAGIKTMKHQTFMGSASFREFADHCGVIKVPSDLIDSPDPHVLYVLFILSHRILTQSPPQSFSDKKFARQDAGAGATATMEHRPSESAHVDQELS